MKSENKKRLLSLIHILRRDSDMDHRLSLNEIISLLEKEDIEVSNRKTLYDDFKVLGDYGYEVEYDNGYYLSDAPFSLSEIKIITDSLNSLKNLDDSFLKAANDKLYSFISEYDQSFLKKLEYRGKHKQSHFINRLEDVLSAIKDNRLIIIRRKNKDSETIGPLFLHRDNDYYYLYYHYKGNNKIYHTRFDNISSISLSDQKDDIDISRNTILSIIEESTNSFHGKDSETINFEILDNDGYLMDRLADDFSNIIFTKIGFSIKASINDAFFGKIASYGNKIKISDSDIADRYISFLKGIIQSNQDCSSRKA